MTADETVALALVGLGGHQITPDDAAAAGAVIVDAVDVAGLSSDEVRVAVRRLVERDDLALVSLNLTPRALQVDAAVIALEAGRNVLIERPAAATRADVERLRVAARRSRGRLWERATTVFDEPYRHARSLVASGLVGEVVLVTAHRSYPWAEWRDPDSSISGGLVLQSAGYGLDVVRLVAGRTIVSLRVTDTVAGEPLGRAMRMAAVVTAELDGGALASIVVDYLNPPGGAWARDEVRIIGTSGVLAIDGVSRAIAVTAGGTTRVLTIDPASNGLLSDVVRAIRHGGDTDPTAEALLGSTAALLGVGRERLGGNDQ